MYRHRFMRDYKRKITLRRHFFSRRNDNDEEKKTRLAFCIIIASERAEVHLEGDIAVKDEYLQALTKQTDLCLSRI